MTFCGPITIDLVAVDDLNLACEISMMTGGISFLISPPLTGKIIYQKEHNNYVYKLYSYILLFYRFKGLTSLSTSYVILRMCPLVTSIRMTIHKSQIVPGYFGHFRVLPGRTLSRVPQLG